jgi:hypothetical protein
MNVEIRKEYINGIFVAVQLDKKRRRIQTDCLFIAGSNYSCAFVRIMRRSLLRPSGQQKRSTL